MLRVTRTAGNTATKKCGRARAGSKRLDSIHRPKRVSADRNGQLSTRRPDDDDAVTDHFAAVILTIFAASFALLVMIGASTEAFDILFYLLAKIAKHTIYHARPSGSLANAAALRFFIRQVG